MSNKRYILVVLLILVVFFGFGFYKLKQRKLEFQKLPTPQRLPYTVEAVHPKEGILKEYTTFQGFYEPYTKGFLSTKTNGAVVKLNVSEGDTFKKGQILAVIDPTDIKSQIEATEAKIEAQKAQIQALQVALETQKAIFERDKKLFETGGISKEQFQLSKTKYMQTKAQYEAALSNLKALQAQLKNLKHNLEVYTYIRAPYDGVVRKLLVREGDFVGAGKPLMETAKTDLYRILVNVPLQTSVGKEGFITLGGKEYKLTVNRVLPSTNQNLKVVEILTQKLPLPDDSYINVSLPTKECKGFIVPFGAVLYLDAGTFVVNTDKKLIPVKVGAISKNLACVKGNLSPQMGILVAGQFRLREIALHNWPIRVVYINTN